MSELRVIHADIAALDFCNRGARPFLARHGIDWSDFMKNGVEASVLREIGDEMGLMAIAQAKKRVVKERTSGR